MLNRVSLGVASLSSHPRYQGQGDSSRRSTGPFPARDWRPEPSPLKPYSILFDAVSTELDEAGTQPECFRDLNLDQIVTAATAGRQEYHLTRFFHLPLKHHQSIGYRQAVFKDLEDEVLVGRLRVFAQHMDAMRKVLATVDKLWYLRQKQRGFLEAVNDYCLAVNSLGRDLASTSMHSIALCGFRDFLLRYQQSDAFRRLEQEIHALKADLAAIEYRLRIEGSRIQVSRYESDPDYGEEVARTFAKFREGQARQSFDFKVAPTSFLMNSVDAAILERVALLFPEAFFALEQFNLRHRDYLEPSVATFDRELQFYLGLQELIQPLRRAGLSFCYPDVTDYSKDIDCHGAFDLALALKSAGKAVPVTNDFYLQRPERILVVSGANQGGKTTFARMVGQVHYLGRLGCPVPGRDAKLFLFDELFTHFEREEDLDTLRSKLEDDLVRIHAILERATPKSLLVMNESFSSSTLKDALLLSREILKQIVERDLICAFVTFLDELASFSRSTVSMVAIIEPEDPAQRTFKIIRKPADGLAYALAVAAKHGLTEERIRERLSG
jgi:DNA mismatch repair protein MutS